MAFTDNYVAALRQLDISRMFGDDFFLTWDKTDDELAALFAVADALRALRGLQKKPSTSELIDWVQALQIGGIPASKIEKEMPFTGVLLKKNEDLDTLTRSKTQPKRW